jgi:drug/metabolite transporter (DMT)-like permease
LIAVCFLWGTTYLGIRISLESVPPMYLIAGRYVISGSILLAVAAFTGAKVPSGRELFYTALFGIICIGIGNGTLAIAELWIPSGLAALFYTTAPFWMVGIDAALPGGKKPLISTLGGLVVGLVGVVFLVAPAAAREGFRGRTVAAFLLLQLGGIGWMLGSLLQKRVHTHSQPFVSGAVQQLAAGLAVSIPAILFEQVPRAITARSLVAIAYLVVFGSIVGFSAFIYSMAELPVAMVSIYTFVNPAVAVSLGWLFFREPFGYRELVGMTIIFAGIILVRWSETNKRASVLVPAADEVGTMGDPDSVR